MSLSPERPFALTHPGGECVRGLIHETRRAPVGIYIPGFRSHMEGNKALGLAQMAQARGRSWIRFDQRGMGRSDGRFKDITLSRYLADIRLLMKMLAPRPIIFVGSSLGGWLAVLAASRWPEQVAGMVLIAPSFNFIQRLYRDLSDAERKQWSEAGEMTFPDRYGGPDFQLNFTFVQDAWRHDCLRWPPTLACPVHILHGDRDDAVPLFSSEAFAKSYRGPHITLQVLSGADHRISGRESDLLRAVDAVWPREENSHV